MSKLFFKHRDVCFVYYFKFFLTRSVQLTRAKYKELVDQTVELAKYKNLVIKLQGHLKNRSAKIKQLESKVQYCKKAHNRNILQEKLKHNLREQDGGNKKTKNTKV